MGSSLSRDPNTRLSQSGADLSAESCRVLIASAAMSKSLHGRTPENAYDQSKCPRGGWGGTRRLYTARGGAKCRGSGRASSAAGRGSARGAGADVGDTRSATPDIATGYLRAPAERPQRAAELVDGGSELRRDPQLTA